MGRLIITDSGWNHQVNIEINAAPHTSGGERVIPLGAPY